MTSISKILSPFRFLFSSYKKLAFVIFPRLYRKIPKLIWGSAAAFGFFALGVLFALSVEGDGKNTEAYKYLAEKEESYLNLIAGYDELSRLYNFQGQNFSTITDMSLYQTNPEEVYEALASSNEFKDKILVQQGRILEQRKNAGLLIEKSN